MDIDQLSKQVPFLEPEFLNELEQYGIFKRVPAFTHLLKEGSYVQSVPLVLNGRIKVFSRSEDRELLLYYIQAGQGCIMSFAAVMNEHISRIEAITEEETDLVLLPASQMQNWLSRFPSIHRFIYNLYDQRYLELVDQVNHLVFWKMEDRLLKYLKDKAQFLQTEDITITHQQIADDLGTAREVISRVLKKLEVEGKVKLNRNYLTIL